VNGRDSGLPASSIRRSSACVLADRENDASAVFSVSKTLMSAPAMNVVPAPISTIASAAGSRAARATASSMPSRQPG
jgi:hypothetical protein